MDRKGLRRWAYFLFLFLESINIILVLVIPNYKINDQGVFLALSILSSGLSAKLFYILAKDFLISRIRALMIALAFNCIFFGLFYSYHFRFR